MATKSATWSGSSGVSTRIECYEQSTNQSNNTSLIRGDVWVDVASGWYLSTSSASFTATIGGNPKTWNLGSTTFNTGSTYIGTFDVNYSHNTDGSGTAVFSASSSSTYGGTASTGDGYVTMTDFARVPGQCGQPSISRNRTTGSATTTAPSSPLPITQYSWQYSVTSADSGYSQLAFSTGTSIGITFSGATTPYWIRVQASTSDGWGPWSSVTYVPGAPQAPGSCTAVRDGRDVTVTSGVASGENLTGYSVQYSTDGGTNWSSAVSMVNRTHTYYNLTPALTYVFKVYASNSSGNSDTTSSAPLFVPAGGKRNNGTTFVQISTAKRFDGSNWVDLTIAKRFDGSNWVDLG